jgi:uncharacterized membrane protein YbaN (DUF454 family)
MACHEHRFNLPANLRDSDAELERMAARALRHERVRSVTVDRERAAAVVRLKRPVANLDFDEIAACATADDSAIDADSTSPDLVSWVDPRDGSISFVRMPLRASGWRKSLYLLLAGVFLALGLIGVVLPGLPTTPFVLLGSYFLLRSSHRLHQRLMASRLFGGILRDWHVHRGIRPHVRVRAIAVVALVVAVSLGVARPPLPVTLGIIALVACGLFVIWRLPSVSSNEA